jgi:DnaK suppressor protein
MQQELVRKRLLAARDEIEARLARTHRHLYQKDEAVSPNFQEQVKQTENDQVVLTLEHGGQQQLQQINEALQRLEAGLYLQCSNCGAAIGEQRLQALPWTSLCVNCAALQ